MTRALLKRLGVALFALVACESAVVFQGSDAPAGRILIASDLPTSGLSRDAAAAERAIRLAIQEHARIGNFRLGYWSLDDALAGSASPDKGIQNIDQIIDESRVLGVIGSWASAVSEVEIPLANQQQLVMISPANTRACLTMSAPYCAYVPQALRPTGPNNYFRIAAPDPLQGLAMARYVARERAVARVAVINELGLYGSALIESFASELRRDGGQIVKREDVDGGTKDFRAFLQQAHDAGAQAVYAVGDSDHSICLARAQMSDGALFLGPDSVALDPKCVAQAGGQGNGMLATKPDVDIRWSTDPAVVAELKAFARTNPGVAVGEYTFAAYDCAQILIAAITQAVEAAGNSLPNRPEVLAQMASIHYHGLTGEYAFGRNGDALSPLMSLYTVQGGAWTYVDKLDASAAS